MSNVNFLVTYDKSLDQIFERAESYLHNDPNTALIKIRQFAEMLAQFTAVQVGIPEWQRGTQADLLNLFRHRGVYGELALNIFHSIRKTGNKATHGTHGTVEEAATHLKLAWQLAVTFHKAFSKDPKFESEFKMPKPQSNEEKKKQEARALSAEKELAAIQEKLKIIEANVQSQGLERAREALTRVKNASDDLKLDEKETRKLIDEQIRDAGWDVDTENLRYSKGTRPQKHKNIAIAEWPTKSGPADYALFCGLKLVGVVEAKKKSVDVKAKIEQAGRYAKTIEASDDFEFVGNWEEYKVPFLYSTNGRPYLDQLKEKSGIWFLDTRLRTNHARPLLGWPSPEGLEQMSLKDTKTAIVNLKTESVEYLPLRDYQKDAVLAVEGAIQDGKRSIMVAMATGTGKTRTCIGLSYRLIKSGMFRRILFLVDRTSLGSQAADSFNEMKIEDNKTFAQMYDIKGLDEMTPETSTKIHFATVQALVKRVLYPSAEADIIPVDQYDCIIVDECHRGYTLDKELSDDEFSYRDENDYISKYRRVLEYFDAVRIGLTATPALHTTEIFDIPVYNYSYREAVIDGFLVDHEEPYVIKTKLSEVGIKFAKDTDVPMYDPATSSIQLAKTPDELKLDVTDFNTKVITENFNKVVCEQLVNHIEWDTREKTLIFCARDDHADMFVRLLTEAFEAKGDKVDNDAIRKITSSSDKPLELIKKFKIEKFPTIAVTVDLLSTGIDVPEICNLVFVRVVRSRILYDQMMGRATRLCDKIGKETFKIFDAVDLYKNLQPYSAMKPVTPKPSITFEDLASELKKSKNESSKDSIIEQIVSKINARKRRLKEENLKEFETLSGGSNPEEFIKDLKSNRLKNPDWFLRLEQLSKWLDRVEEERKKMIISNHHDEIISVEQGYGKYKKPDDYIEGFSKFVKDNINLIPALKIIAQKPRDLTRKELKEVRLLIENAGFKEQALQTAYKNRTSKDIAASLIGFIRVAAIGDALLPFNERLENAIVRLKSKHQFTPIQMKWIDRIKSQIEVENVVDKESLDSGAFKLDGGFQKADRVFDGKIDVILHELNELIWSQAS